MIITNKYVMKITNAQNGRSQIIGGERRRLSTTCRRVCGALAQPVHRPTAEAQLSFRRADNAFGADTPTPGGGKLSRTTSHTPAAFIISALHLTARQFSYFSHTRNILHNIFIHNF